MPRKRRKEEVTLALPSREQIQMWGHEELLGLEMENWGWGEGRGRKNQSGNRFDETRKKGTKRTKGIKIRSSEG